MSLQTLLRSSAIAAALAMTTPLMLSAADATVKEITVSAGPATAEGMNAMTYYPEMEADLQQAIAERVPLSDEPNGYVVQVSLDKVALNGETYPVNLQAESAGPAPEGFVTINPGPDEFYVAMIVAFADVVAERLPEYMPDASAP